MIYNFKQLAEGKKTIDGKRLKNNYLVRTAYIQPNEENKKFVESLGINTIFDFRSSFEIEKEPNFKDLDVVYYPIGKVKNEEVMKENKIKFQLPDMVKFYAEGIDDCQYMYQAIRDIIENPRPLLYHCTAGKDRTGMYSIILMHMLGFRKQDIKDHYLVLDPKFIENARNKFKDIMKDVDKETFEGLITVKPEYFDAFYDAIVKRYGSFDNYISENLKVTESELNNFRNYYLK